MNLNKPITEIQQFIRQSSAGMTLFFDIKNQTQSLTLAGRLCVTELYRWPLNDTLLCTSLWLLVSDNIL